MKANPPTYIRRQIPVDAGLVENSASPTDEEGDTEEEEEEVKGAYKKSIGSPTSQEAEEENMAQPNDNIAQLLGMMQQQQ